MNCCCRVKVSESVKRQNVHFTFSDLKTVKRKYAEDLTNPSVLFHSFLFLSTLS